MFKKQLFCAVLAIICILSLAAPALAADEEDFILGNSDLNILNGGIMLTNGEDFYFSLDGGIFVKRGDAVRAVCAADAKNLNLYDGYIYFTEANSIYRVPEGGGEAQRVHTADEEIKQMYVVSGDIFYVSKNCVFELKNAKKDAKMLKTPKNVFGLIPTEFGLVYLTGKPHEYSVFAENEPVAEGVSSCYTDSGCLVLQIDDRNYQLALSDAFSGSEKARELKPFSLHGTVRLLELLAPDDENSVSDYNENHDLELDFSDLLKSAGMTENVRLLASEDGSEELTFDVSSEPEPISAEPVIPTVSQGQMNIVKRARQLAEIKWTPLEDRYQWGYYGVFKAENTYTGIPYGQPVNTNGYIGYGVSLDGYAEAMLDNNSRFYTGYSDYNKIAPAFSTDCSGFVSYAWGLAKRKTTYSLQEVAEKVGEQSIYSLQVGDCMNKSTSHVVLVSELTYGADGEIVGVTIMEQTPVITKTTRYGEGGTKSLASLQSYYIGGGYVICRYPGRETVTYTPSAAVPLDGELPAGMKNPAPKTATSSFVGGKTVALRSESGGPIYYTIDGSEPSVRSTLYTGELTFTETCRLMAIAPGDCSESAVLRYSVKIPFSDTPEASVFAGLSIGNLVSRDAKITLKVSDGSTIYYTTDGSEPDSGSTKYTSPIVLTSDTTIKAVAEKAGQRRSETMTASYTVGETYTITASALAGGDIAPAGKSLVLETGSKVISISPQTGYEIKDVLVDGVSVGAAESYEFKDVRENHTIEATFAINVQTPFTDVPEGAWYREAVAYAYASKLFNGTSETTFSPEQTMTRGMVVTVLGRSAGIELKAGETAGLVTGSGVNIRSGPSVDSEKLGMVERRYSAAAVLGQEGEWYKVRYGTVTGYIRGDLLKVYDGAFTDVSQDAYYSPYAQWASLAGITSGTSENTFSPETQISREQLCTLLGKYADVFSVKLDEGEDGSAFSDDEQISAYARDYVYALRNAGVINGMGDGGFLPQGTATRAQVAQVFMKLLTAAG